MLSVRLLIRSVSHNLFESSWTLDYFVFFSFVALLGHIQLDAAVGGDGDRFRTYNQTSHVQSPLTIRFVGHNCSPCLNHISRSAKYSEVEPHGNRERETKKNTDKTLHTLRSMQFSFASPACSAVQVKNLWNAMARAFFVHLSHFWLWNGF